MDYVEADEEVFAVLKEQGSSLWATVKTTPFPNTYRALFGFCVKANALKSSMFDMIESDNPYAFKTLFRCFCEHYLKFTYVFARFLREKSDAAGTEYFSYCGAAEAVEYADALNKTAILLGNPVVDANAMREVVDRFYPRAMALSSKELKAASGKFKYRSILRFLSGQDPSFITRSNPFLASILPEYARLSSFVHGGPWTDQDMLHYAKPEALEECRKYAGLAMMMAASVVMFTAMAVSREFPETGVIAAQIGAILKRYRGE